MKPFKISAIALCFAAIGGFSACNSTNTMTENKVKAIDKANMDESIKPGEDFFRYANGGWIAANPIPEEYSRYGAFEVLDKMNKERIKSIIDTVSKQTDAPQGSPAQQIGDYYRAAMDTETINKLGFDPIKPVIAEINALESIKQIPALHASLNFKGTFPFFTLYAAQDDKQSDRVIAQFVQGGISLPDRDYYTSDDEMSKEIRANYKEYLKDMFGLIEYNNDQAKAAADVVMNIETKMAEFSWTRLQNRDPKKTYNLMKVSELQKLMPEYDFEAYFSGLGLSNIDIINVHQPDFAKGLGSLLSEISLDDWKTYLIWKVVNGNASQLSEKFENLKFDFFGKKLSGQPKMQERWKRTVSSINGNLGEAMGKLYVEQYFPEEAKIKMEKLVNNLKISLGESIENLEWMTAETKVKAKEKLDAIRVKVGYPNKWKDYSSIDIKEDTYVQNIWNCSKFSYQDNLSDIGKPVDREEWGMTPQTVNAYYSPNMNEIVFPAAILQPPFFDMNADDAVNYGAIGVVIGHEMTHGFDDQGRLYDKDGNLKDWWTDEDAEKYKAKTKIIVDQYSKYEILDSMFINGELTLGENIADNGGLYIAHNALLKSFETNGEQKDIDGLTFNQRFLISYAQVWRQSIREKELKRRLKEDVHSPGEARVNAGVANLPWWYESFNISKENKFYIEPENRAKIW